MPISDRLGTIHKAPASRGKTNLLKYLRGERLTQRQAIIAKCCDCMCYHVDGRIDCQQVGCPLYTWFPYKRGVVPSEIKP